MQQVNAGEALHGVTIHNPLRKDRKTGEIKTNPGRLISGSRDAVARWEKEMGWEGKLLVYGAYGMRTIRYETSRGGGVVRYTVGLYDSKGEQDE